MTYSDVISRGYGKLVYGLEIVGIPWLFTTEDIELDKQSTFDGRKPWLSYSGIAIDEKVSFIEGSCTVGGLSLEIVDIDAGMTALLSDFRARNATVLTDTLDAGETTTMTVESTSAFPSSGKVWVGQECISYTGKTATTFTTLTRGVYGTHDSEHEVDATRVPIPLQPTVVDGPEFLVGRRANLYVAEYASIGTLTTTTLYRGFVSGDIEAGEGVWTLSLEHITRMLSRSVGKSLPSTKVKPSFYVSGSNRQVVVEIFSTTRTGAEFFLTEGLYNSADDLAEAWNTAARTEYVTQSFVEYPFVLRGESGKFSVVITSNSASYAHDIYIEETSPLRALGFDAGLLTMSMGNAEEPFVFEAQNEPMVFFLDMEGSTNQVNVESTEGFKAGQQFGMIEGFPYFKISGVNTTTNVITIRTTPRDPFTTVRDVLRNGQYIYSDEEDDKGTTLQQIIAFDESNLKDAIKTCLAQGAGTEPDSWLVTGVYAADIDWTELDDALAYAPGELRSAYGVVTKETGIDKLFCDHLGLLGIVPRLTTDGKIGFVAMQAPAKSQAIDLEIDDEVWALSEATSVKTSAESRTRINEVIVNHTKGYYKPAGSKDNNTDKGMKSTLTFFDGVSELNKTKYKKYETPLLRVSNRQSSRAVAQTDLELLIAMIIRCGGVHFGTFGRLCTEIRIPCTWTAKSIKVGDIVSVTHPCAIDPAQGAIGLTERYGIVTEKNLPHTANEPDYITIILPPVRNIAPIAPCAKATSWDSGTKTLGFSATNLFAKTGDTDLTNFAAGDEVAFLNYDNTTGGSYSEATIVSKTVNTVVLDVDPGFSSFPADGVLMFFASYDNCTADQQTWLFEGDPSYTLGTSNDEAYVWSI